MGKRQPVYTPEFRKRMVELVGAGRSPQDLSREFGPTAQSIRNWVARSGLNPIRVEGGLRASEREELVRLRRENRQLQLKLAILLETIVWLAGNTNVIPSGDSIS